MAKEKLCKPGSIYSKMLDEARELIEKYFDSSEQNIDLFVSDVSSWMDKYSIDSSVKKYPAIKDNKEQFRKAQILDIWMYHLAYAMQRAIDDVSREEIRNPREN